VSEARFLPRWEVADVAGSVVVVDVLRAFTTAAYAFAAGAAEIWLVSRVDEALAFKHSHPGALAMGEDGGRRVPGFDLSNSPVEAYAAPLVGRTVVQRTSAGTQGVIAAPGSARMWCASLVCATATAAAVNSAALGAPTYVVTGRFPDGPVDGGADDLLTAEFIEAVRRGEAPDAARVAREVRDSREADFTLALGAGHVHADDIAYATDVDRFDFAMEVERRPSGLCLTAVRP
jgi:2-phosphosulfolactate phosphatase